VNVSLAENPAFAEEDEWRIALLHPRKTFIESRIAPRYIGCKKVKSFPIGVGSNGRQRRTETSPTSHGRQNRPISSSGTIRRRSHKAGHKCGLLT
jgi:hypothetical protein